MSKFNEELVDRLNKNICGRNGDDLLSMVMQIKTVDIRIFVLYALSYKPEYFKITSSVTGKHHPRDEYRPGGQWLHTMRVFRVMQHLIEQDGKLSENEKDILLAATILHDLNKVIDRRDETAGIKYLLEKLRDYWKEKEDTDTWWSGQLLELIAIHGGNWTPEDFVINGVQYKYNPVNKLHKYMHLADYIASRNDIIVDVSKAYDKPNKRWKITRKIVEWFTGGNNSG